MLEFILNLSFWQGIFMTTLTICALGLLVIVVAKKCVAPHLKKEHEKVGRLLFRVTAGLIALLISLSYANERVAQGKIMDSLEEEASLLVNSTLLLRLMDTPQGSKIEEKLKKYIDLTINDQWENTVSNPFYSDGAEELRQAYKMTVLLPAENGNQEQLKNRLLDNLDQVIKLMQVRIYSQTVLIPKLIYILCLGMVFMWIFFSVYSVDRISLSFITLYNIFISTLIYFILALSNPLAGPMKMKAHAFEIIQVKGIERTAD